MPELSADNALIAAAIESAAADAAQIETALTKLDDRTEQAAWSIVAGKHCIEDAVAWLWPLLDDDDLCARAACWALGQLNSEAFVLDHIADAGIDQREHAYTCLAHIAARGAQSDQLAHKLIDCVNQELKRVADGRTGLGEHACRVLAVLGAEQADAAIKDVTNKDQYSDRFELQRLRKAVADDGKDNESIQTLTAAWTEQFADDLAVHDATSESSESEAAPVGETASDNAAVEAEMLEPTQAGPENLDEEIPDGAEDPDAPPPVTPKPIDWAAFLESDEAQVIDDQGRQVIQQMGPMLEQLALQALGKNLCDLSAQELVVMVLQVLPQAIPPEYMQAALSPPSLNGMQALTRYLARNDLCEHGADLEEGVRQIRGHIQQQIRASGSLHGSDYDEPNFDQGEDNTDEA